MTQQKSEDCIVPEGRRKSAPTQDPGGGKAVPVTGVDQQLLLFAATAENPQKSGAESKRKPGRPGKKIRKVPKATNKQRTAGLARMEEVVECLNEALAKVVANKGAPGPDGQTVDHVLKHWETILPKLRQSLLDGTYGPGNIRRCWIPKPDGKKQRGLGIPNVIDRWVAEAVRQVIEPLYEPTFHPSSHGFRPKCGCQTAIREAKSYVEEGYQVVVDIDLANFFGAPG